MTRAGPKAPKLTQAQYNTVLQLQGGVCAICGRPPKNRKLNVDHDHKGPRGEVRGLLCHRCNRGLTWFNDRPERLRIAATYLEGTRYYPEATD